MHDHIDYRRLDFTMSVLYATMPDNTLGLPASGQLFPLFGTGHCSVGYSSPPTTPAINPRLPS